MATARDIMTPDPVTVAPTLPVTDAAKLMVEKRIGSLPVLEGEKLVVALRVLDADGAERPAYTRTIDVDLGKFALELPLGLNEHGKHTVVIKEPCSGLVKKVEVNVP